MSSGLVLDNCNCPICPGRLGVASSFAGRKLGRVCAASSNRVRTIVLGSPGKGYRVGCDNALAVLLWPDCILARREPSEAAYSGILEKLSGFTMTLYVPGACDSALRSRSSSVFRSANNGRPS